MGFAKRGESVEDAKKKLAEWSKELKKHSDALKATQAEIAFNQRRHVAQRLALIDCLGRQEVHIDIVLGPCARPQLRRRHVIVVEIG